MAGSGVEVGVAAVAEDDVPVDLAERGAANDEAAGVLGEVDVGGDRVAVLGSQRIGIEDQKRRDGGFAGKKEEGIDGGLVLDAVAGMIPGDMAGSFEAEALEAGVFGIPLVFGMPLVVADVRDLDEPDLRGKVRGVVLVDVVEGEGMALAGDFEPGSGSGAGLRLGLVRRAENAGVEACAGQGLCSAFDDLAERGPLVVEAGGGVHAANAVKAAGELVVGVYGADAGAFADVLGDAAHGEESVFVVAGIAGVESLAGSAVVDGEDTDVGVVELAGDANAEFGVNDVAGVEEIDGRGEIIGVFEEKGAEFGEVDGVALVDRELGLVGFDLTEIGVNRGVDDDAVMQDGFGFAAGSALESARTPSGIVGVNREEFVHVLAQDIGIEL